MEFDPEESSFVVNKKLKSEKKINEKEKDEEPLTIGEIKKVETISEGEVDESIYGESFVTHSKGSSLRLNEKQRKAEHIKERKDAVVKKVRESNIITRTLRDENEEEVTKVQVAISQLNEIMEILSSYSHGELSDMIKYKDKEEKYRKVMMKLESLKPKGTKEKIAILSVDPAPTTCGVSLIDISQRKTINVDRRAFRFKSQESEVGFDNVLEKASQYFRFFLCDCVYVIMEDQKAGTFELSDNIRNEQYFLESHSIQCAIKGMFGESCAILAPSYVKKYFGMTQLDKSKYKTVESYRSAQYRKNKENAVKLGQHYSSQYVRNRIVKITGCHDHNIYDTVVNGMCVIYGLAGMKGKQWRRTYGSIFNFSS
jgi:hypothetical protein